MKVAAVSLLVLVATACHPINEIAVEDDKGCPAAFAALGLELTSGAARAGQTLFSVAARQPSAPAQAEACAYPLGSGMQTGRRKLQLAVRSAHPIATKAGA